MDISVNQDGFPSSESQPSKRRRKKSMVWDHFTIQKVNSGDLRACCNQCKKLFAYISGTKLAGTSHLKRHITLGICPVGRYNQQIDLPIQDTPASTSNISVNGTNRPRRRFRAANSVTNILLARKDSGHEFAKMIIKHDYSLDMGEHSGFIKFAQVICPKFSKTTIGKVEQQVEIIYKREKQKLQDLLTGISGRLNLTVDLWTSNQGSTYLLLSGHFTDSNWKLQRRILNLVEVPFPDSEAATGRSVASCLREWNSEGKLFTVTLDRSLVNENSKRVIRGLQSIGNSHILNGQLIVNSCYACVLSNLAQDALGFVKEIIEKVRHSVKYVKTSGIHEEKFIKLKEKLQVPSAKNLMIDDITKWNTTYDMLVAASELKEVFSCLDTYDQDYKSTPSMEEWNQVESLCIYLKLFYKAAQIIASPVYPTTNILFHDVWKILHELMQGAVNQDLFIRNLTKSLLEKFTKFWKDCNLVLAVAVVMDPRAKMEAVKFSFARIYGEDTEAWMKIVSSNLGDLYLDYWVQELPGPIFIEKGEHNMLKMESSLPPPTFIEGHHDVLKMESLPSPTFIEEGDHGVLKMESLPSPTCTEEGDHNMLKMESLPSPTCIEEGDHNMLKMESLPSPTCIEEGDHNMLKMESLSSSPTLMEVVQGDSLLNYGDQLQDYDDNDIFLSDFNCEDLLPENTKSELEVYLEEPIMRRVQDFDVLGWWKANQPKYPTLSKMACDVLSIPLSTLAPENVFDTKGRTIDSHRSTLTPTTLEALICSKDWLQYVSSSYTEKRSETAGIPSPTVKTEL